MSCTSTLDPRLRSWRTACSGAGPDSSRVALRRPFSFSNASGVVGGGDDHVGLRAGGDGVGHLAR